MEECTATQNGKLVDIRVPGYENTSARYDGGEIPW